MAYSHLREELGCSICLEIYRDPVTLRCGHNFCQVCIQDYLNRQEKTGVYSCPECREEFTDRSDIRKNKTLHNIAQHFLSAQPDQEETKIFCTYCDSPVPAVRSCLQCETSMCDSHLRKHNKSVQHTLLPTTINLCCVHKKILEYFCSEDAACLCASCRLEGKHQGHQVETLEEASEKKKEKLRNVLQNLSREREEAEKRVQRLQERKRDVQEKAAGITERLVGLFTDIRRQLEDLEKRVLVKISHQEDQISQSISGLIQELEVKKDELTRKMRHIEELCNTTDPVTVLQEPEAGDVCGSVEDEYEDRAREERQVHDARDIGEDVIAQTLDKGLSDIMSSVKREFHVLQDSDVLLDGSKAGNRAIVSSDVKSEKENEDRARQGKPSHDAFAEVLLSESLLDAASSITKEICVMIDSEVLLNVTTAGNKVTISADMKTASYAEENQGRPETAERFEYYQVLSAQSFSSGQQSWEVETSEPVRWRIGVCYSSTPRKGGQSLFGNNTTSWCLRWSDNELAGMHNGKVTQLPHKLSRRRLRICLDYEAGQLSFYEQGGHLRHLHTFTATFTEPLHAALCVWTGWVRIQG